MRGEIKNGKFTIKPHGITRVQYHVDSPRILIYNHSSETSSEPGPDQFSPAKRYFESLIITMFIYYIEFSSSDHSALHIVHCNTPNINL